MGFGRFMVALPLAGALLAGCGGSGGSGGAVGAGAGSAPVQAGQSGQAGAAIDIAAFSSMARGAMCATTRNRLYVIDGKQVFWDRAGACADASYEQVLYGAAPQAVLCSHGDTIAGPRTVCQDAGAKAQFDTMIANLEKPDLGLGSGHKVEPVPFLPKAGTSVAFESIASSATSGVTAPRQVVVRDAAAWAKLWAEHGSQQIPAPPLPAVDFTRKMLVAVFAGAYHEACYGQDIVAIRAGADKLVVDIDEHGPRMNVRCAQLATNPMQVVAVDRIDANVEFVVTPILDVAFESLGITSHSKADAEQNVVAQDAAAYARLWAQFDPATTPPQVDFATNMVVGVFMGTRPSGCYATGVASVVSTPTTLRVQRADRVPGDGVICAQVMTSPAQLVVVPRSSLPVTFVTATQPGSP